MRERQEPRVGTRELFRAKKREEAAWGGEKRQRKRGEKGDGRTGKGVAGKTGGRQRAQRGRVE